MAALPAHRRNRSADTDTFESDETGDKPGKRRKVDEDDGEV